MVSPRREPEQPVLPTIVGEHTVCQRQPVVRFGNHHFDASHRLVERIDDSSFDRERAGEGDINVSSSLTGLQGEIGARCFSEGIHRRRSIERLLKMRRPLLAWRRPHRIRAGPQAGNHVSTVGVSSHGHDFRVRAFHARRRRGNRPSGFFVGYPSRDRGSRVGRWTRISSHRRRLRLGEAQ